MISIKRELSTITLVSIILLFSESSWGQSTIPTNFRLVFDGDTNASYKAVCKIETSSGPTLVAIDGQVPHEHELFGKALSCKIETVGRVTIDAIHGGNRTRSATKDGVVNLNFQ